MSRASVKIMILIGVPWLLLALLPSPVVAQVSAGVSLSRYASVLATRTYGHTEPLFYMVVTIYLLVYTTYMALFLGKFGGSGMRIVRDGYQIAAVIAAGIGV